MRQVVTRVSLAAMLAVSMAAMPGTARADGTQPAVARPEITQFRVDRAVPGECDVISIHTGSDDSLFGTNGSDGVR